MPNGSADAMLSFIKRNTFCRDAIYFAVIAINCRRIAFLIILLPVDPNCVERIVCLAVCELPMGWTVNIALFNDQGSDNKFKNIFLLF